MKKSNNNISDWLEKYGDPEVEKQVEEEIKSINEMQKYKLIKKYPGSPEIGEIWKKQGEHNDHYYGKSPHRWIHEKQVENHPEFWEEVIDKDYEIITFGFEGGIDRTLDNNGKYSLIRGGITDSMDGNRLIDLIETTDYYIKTVKRLSDGAIFTVGDICNPVGSYYKDNEQPITVIWFTDDGSLRISSDNYTLGINGIEHSKMPLFTTEDGEDMYDGDKYYYVTESGKEVYTNIARNEKPLSENGKRFSTKKAAENYIYNNEKRFSINDVLEAIPLDSDDVKTTLSKMLDNLKVF